MSTAVVYCSQTGYTRTYARWLAESLGTESLPFERRDEAATSGADTLVFLSWFHAGGLKGAKWLRGLMDAQPGKRYVVVGVGAYPMPSEDWPQSDTDEAFERAFPRERYSALKHFYCQGGFDFDRLCTLDKLAMRAFFRMQAKAAETDPRIAFALESMKQGFDGTNRAYLQPVLDYLGA